MSTTAVMFFIVTIVTYMGIIQGPDMFVAGRLGGPMIPTVGLFELL